MLSMVRWYNLLVVIISQYLASLYILNPHDPKLSLLLDYKLHLITLSTTFLLAAGYIINSFYDQEKDLVNRPNQNVFDRLVSKEFSLTCYFIFNGIGVVAALMVSREVGLFHFILSFVLWFYSHKLKKIPLLAELSASSLLIAPFFSIVVYYKTVNATIFYFVWFMFTVDFIRQFVKGLETEKGDVIFDYHTFPVYFGTKATKRLAGLLMTLNIIPVILLYEKHGWSIMHYYLFSAYAIGMTAMVLLFRAKEEKQIRLVNNVLKVIMVAGVMAITLLRYE